MVAALAQAIIVGLLFVKIFTNRKPDEREFSGSEVLREAYLNDSVFLLVGSLFVGIVTSQQGWESLKPFTGEMFYGVLTFFLLDIGLIAARRIQDLIKSGLFLMGFSILMRVFNALITMSKGNTLLFAVLCSSASYIAVPAAMRMTVPEANPSLYISMALALTFPFNIIIGIPVDLGIINQFWS